MTVVYTKLFKLYFDTASHPGMHGGKQRCIYGLAEEVWGKRCMDIINVDLQ